METFALESCSRFLFPGTRGEVFSERGLLLLSDCFALMARFFIYVSFGSKNHTATAPDVRSHPVSSRSHANGGVRLRAISSRRSTCGSEATKCGQVVRRRRPAVSRRPTTPASPISISTPPVPGRVAAATNLMSCASAPLGRMLPPFLSHQRHRWRSADCWFYRLAIVCADASNLTPSFEVRPKSPRRERSRFFHFRPSQSPKTR